MILGYHSKYVTKKIQICKEKILVILMFIPPPEKTLKVDVKAFLDSLVNLHIFFFLFTSLSNSLSLKPQL